MSGNRKEADGRLLSSKGEEDGDGVSEALFCLGEDL